MINLTLYPVIPSDITQTQKILDEQIHIKQELLKKYQTLYAGLSTPSDEASLKQIHAMAEKIKALHPTMLLLVGIGGSTMGTLAVVQALYGSMYNDTTSGMRFYWADTIDIDLGCEMYMRVESEFAQGGTVILCIVTKSGTTTETVVNGAFFLELLKKYKPADYYNYVVCISDEDSALSSVAHDQKYLFLSLPKDVGGRYSVFTAVALLPLALLGIDIDDFCKGATIMRNICLQQELEQNNAAQSALMLDAHYQAGYALHDLFVFSPDLLMLGNWYKQLIGESLGKKYDLQGNLIEIGITPLVSVGTVDLHSVAQLYLAGPRNKVTTFITIDREQDDIHVPQNEISTIVPGLASKSITFIKKAIFQGVTQAYEHENRPFMIVTLKEKSSYALGEFMMMKMIETIFLAKLWNINAFDQPAVELYKKRAHELMR